MPESFRQKITNPNCKRIKAAQKFFGQKSCSLNIGEIDTRRVEKCQHSCLTQNQISNSKSKTSPLKPLNTSNKPYFETIYLV
jgi:hypothetical protein